MSSDQLSKGQWQIAQSAGFLLSPVLLLLLKGLPASPVASLVQVVGHEGTDGRLSGFVIVIIIVETFAALVSRQVHDGFPVRPYAHLPGATVACLQSAVVGEVLVLLEYPSSDPLQHVVAAHLRRDGLQTDRLAAYFNLVQAPDHGLFAMP